MSVWNLRQFEGAGVAKEREIYTEEPLWIKKERTDYFTSKYESIRSILI